MLPFLAHRTWLAGQGTNGRCDLAWECQRCLGAVSEVDADETSTVDSSGSDVEKEARTVSQGLSRQLPQSLASSSSRQEIDVQSWSIVGRKAPVVQRAVESVEAG